MTELCGCEEWENIVKSYELFEYKPPYGWVLSWTEVTKEKGYSQLHRYGISIRYCPMCGKPLDVNS